MKSKIKIIRVLWGDTQSSSQEDFLYYIKKEIPPIPIQQNQIVYVWGKENQKWLDDKGFKTRLVEETEETENTTFNTMFFRKLIALDLALQEFGEVILLDWDCYILRKFDDQFYQYLQEKPIQCPLYAYYKDVKISCLEVDDTQNQSILDFIDTIDITINQYSWKREDILVSPNFCFVYSRDKTLGKKLIDIALKHNIRGCIEEHAMFLYADCTLNEYIERYQPNVVQGVSDTITINNLLGENSKRKLNDYVRNIKCMDIYMEHI